MGEGGSPPPPPPPPTLSVIILFPKQPFVFSLMNKIEEVDLGGDRILDLSFSR